MIPPPPLALYSGHKQGSWVPKRMSQALWNSGFGLGPQLYFPQALGSSTLSLRYEKRPSIEQRGGRRKVRLVSYPVGQPPLQPS